MFEFTYTMSELRQKGVKAFATEGKTLSLKLYRLSRTTRPAVGVLPSRYITAELHRDPLRTDVSLPTVLTQTAPSNPLRGREGKRRFPEGHHLGRNAGKYLLLPRGLNGIRVHALPLALGNTRLISQHRGQWLLQTQTPVTQEVLTRTAKALQDSLWTF